MRRLVFCVLAMVLLTAAASGSRDALALKALEEAGSDLHKTHQVSFFIVDIASLKSSEALLADLRSLRFDVRVWEDDDGFFLLEARQSIVPTELTMTKFSEDFDRLTKQHGGRYDGWSADVVK